MIQKNKGFTLIELLVVIAIIGVLASVVLAAVNSARTKGIDAAVKANLANARAQAELYYDANANSYLGVCSTTAVSGVKTINDIVLGAGKAFGLTALTTGASSATVAVCSATAAGWAAAVPLKSPSSGMAVWCVDSTGTSGEKAAGTITSTSGSEDITC